MFNLKTNKVMIVTNLQSPRSGKPVENQFCIYMPNGERLFQSYSSIICKVMPDGEIQLAHDAWLSRTTKKYLRVFLGMQDTDIKTFNQFINNLKTF